MLALLFRTAGHIVELAVIAPLRLLGRVIAPIAFNPRLGPLRYLPALAIGYTLFAVTLVYVVAPIRGFVGQYSQSHKLRYDAERWLATAVYDAGGNFVGTFDPRLDSRRDVNYTDAAIELGTYTAHPDHKSIPVREVPDGYWQCLVYHEDRYLGGWLNPYGIDLYGVLKIPYTTVTRTIALRRPSLGVGGSTLPMQFVRVIHNTPPSAAEGSITKLRRKFKEWWLAPVIYHELTRGGDITPLKQWAANHIWLAQRTGGAPLHGVEVTSRIVFGKEAKDLSTAEQFVLASAVNKPIILLTGNDKLNEVRLDRWRYITEVRARICAEQLLTDEIEKKQVLFELIQLASGPPDPRVKPKLQAALDQFAPALAKRAQANPAIRANALIPAARFGIREEMKQAYGFGWREHVRGVTTTLDVNENLAFHERIKAELARVDAQYQSRLNSGFTLDPAKITGEKSDRKIPNVVVVAANAKGEIVRYFETGETAPYFGSPFARDAETGRYHVARESRHIASTGKILLAIGLANEHRDSTETLYADSLAPERGLETCEKGGGAMTQGRKALVSFACSLNRPLEWRAAQLGQERIRRLIETFQFALPPGAGTAEATPPSTAAVRGLISGAPRRVHQMAGVVLAALTDQGGKPVKLPTLVKTYDYTSREAQAANTSDPTAIVPNTVIRPDGHGLLKTLLQAPLCYKAGGTSHGTLKALAHWCPAAHTDLRLHFAKTGTSVTEDPNSTVDTWITGGLQFANGAAYSYVVLVGTGSAQEPWARSLHASQAAVPLLEALLADLAAHARTNPGPLPKPAAAIAPEIAKPAPPREREDWKSRVFQTQ